MEKVSGYKIIGLRVANEKVFCDIAIFGENSLVYENIQLCEAILENIPYEEKEEFDKKYGKELPHNFIREFIHIL